MFFKKKQPPPVEPEPKIEYPASLDMKRDIFPIFIDISAFPNYILSVERQKIDTPQEYTVIYCIDEKGETDQYDFEISRKQHQELIASLNNENPASTNQLHPSPN